MELKFNFWLGHTEKIIGPIHLSEVGKIIIEFTDDIVSLQYIGLKDKNGKEIFKGDIYHIGDPKILYKVIFSQEHCAFVGNQINNKSLAGLSYFMDNIEVIGNIYENPELMNVAS